MVGFAVFVVVIGIGIGVGEGGGEHGDVVSFGQREDGGQIAAGEDGGVGDLTGREGEDRGWLLSRVGDEGDEACGCALGDGG